MDVDYYEGLENLTADECHIIVGHVMDMARKNKPVSIWITEDRRMLYIENKKPDIPCMKPVNLNSNNSWENYDTLVETVENAIGRKLDGTVP